SDVEDVHVAPATRPGVAWPATGADHVELLVVGREAEAIRIGHLVLVDDAIDTPARIDAIAVGRQFAPVLAHSHRLAEPRLKPPCAIARPARSVRRTLVELAAVWRIREPNRTVGMRDDVIRRVEPLAVVRVRDHRDRAVVLVPHDASGQMLAGKLTRRADRKSTRLNSSHVAISYAVFCLKKKTKIR